GRGVFSGARATNAHWSAQIEMPEVGVVAAPTIVAIEAPLQAIFEKWLLADPTDHRMQAAMAMKSPKKKLQAVMLCARSRNWRSRGGRRRRTRRDVGRGKDELSGKFVGGCGFLQPRYSIDSTVLYVSFPEGGEEQASGQD
ncbi:unnamed protein product, partial [Prorocentrum cordatum]